MATESKYILGAIDQIVGQAMSRVGLPEDDLAHTLEAYKAEQITLERHCAEVENRYRDLSHAYGALEQRYHELMSFCVTVSRLQQATNSIAEVVQAIYDVIANLLGCEELLILEPGPENGCFTVLAAFGVDPARSQAWSPERDLLARIMESGSVYLRGDLEEASEQSGEETISACIPFPAAGRASGAVVLFSLLPQRDPLGDADRFLLEHLKGHIAVAFEIARSRQHG